MSPPIDNPELRQPACQTTLFMEFVPARSAWRRVKRHA